MDLHRIASTIARDRPDFAQSYCLKLIEKVETVAQFPMSGRQVPRQPSPNLRELVLPPYRVIYEISFEANIIEIVRVWDGRRDDPQPHDLTT